MLRNTVFVFGLLGLVPVVAMSDIVSNSSMKHNCSARSYEGLNIANICDRNAVDAAIMFIMYFVVFVFAMFSNASVILASIFERWKEIDQFTFVMAVSQSFCHLLLAAFVYPMGAYSMVARVWGLGKLWCWQTALLSSYFEIMYTLHIFMLCTDIIIARFTRLKDNVFVALSKNVALSLWVVALVPQVYVFISKKRGEVFGYNADKERCYATYMYPTWTIFSQYFLIFIFSPLLYSIIQYIVLLYRSKKKVDDDKRIKGSERSFWMNYRTSFIMIILYSVSQFPRWIFIFYTIEMTQMSESGEASSKASSDVRLADFIVLWSSMGSIFIPIGYLITCPTYFHQVTRFTWMAWLRRFGPYLHPVVEPEPRVSEAIKNASASKENIEV